MITNDYLTLLAIVVGPLLAIFVTRHLDNRRERTSRRMDIFRTLMRTRRTPMLPEHVGALNLIEIEFENQDEVISEWRKLFGHFGTNHTRHQTEEISDQMPIDIQRSRDLEIVFTGQGWLVRNRSYWQNSSTRWREFYDSRLSNWKFLKAVTIHRDT